MGTSVLVSRHGCSGSEEGRLRQRKAGGTIGIPECLARVECSEVLKAGHAEVSGT